MLKSWKSLVAVAAPLLALAALLPLGATTAAAMRWLALLGLAGLVAAKAAQAWKGGGAYDAEQWGRILRDRQETTERLMALVRRDPDIAIYLSIRQDDKRLHLYGLTHALHVALAVQLMSRRR